LPEVPLKDPRPCFDRDWETDPETFKKEFPGHIHMHSVYRLLLILMEWAGFGKKVEFSKWLTLFSLPIESLITEDGADPDNVVDETNDNDNLVRAICKYYGQDAHSENPSIRTFALNLAVLNPNETKEGCRQLMSYRYKSSKKTNLHRAYDAAIMLLGKLPKNFTLPAVLPPPHFTTTIHAAPENNLGNLTNLSNNTACHDEEQQTRKRAANSLLENTVNIMEECTTANGCNGDENSFPPIDDEDDDEEEENETETLPPLTVNMIVDTMMNSIKEDDFMVALQDVGEQQLKKVNGKNRLVTGFPLLTNICGVMRKAGWEAGDGKYEIPEFLKKRPTTRERDSIVNMLQALRKKVSVKNLHSSAKKQFLKLNKEKKIEEKYALFPEEKVCTGLRRALRSFFEQKQVAYEDKDKNTKFRSVNDAA
jgi:hypothetical protein